MTDKRTKYTPEFKRGAVELTLLEGKTVKEVANDLDIHPVMLSRWRREYFQEKDAAFPGQGNPKESDQELQRLRREVAQLREERDILKKALVFFSKESK